MMDKGKMILMMTVMAVSLLVIGLRHQNRMMFVELQSLQKTRDDLNIEWGKLLLEEGAWSQQRRVESSARTRMSMNLPTAEQIKVVELKVKGQHGP